MARFRRVKLASQPFFFRQTIRSLKDGKVKNG